VIGPYYTQGMPEDTQALSGGMLDDAEFVSQTDNVMAERWRMLDTVLDNYDGGLLFFYVSTIDQSCHAMWRNVDPHHPAHTDDMGFADRFQQLYVEMDSMLAVVESRIPKDAVLIVMSDHGFAPYYKKFHLNTWLYQNGYLALIRPEEIGQHPLLGNVFWRRTKAYALGINGMYVNLLGRERRGIVRAGELYDQLLDEISQGLLAYRDPENGEQVITTVYKNADIYHGPYAKDAPDLVIGYNRGYRGSDESALGTLTKKILVPNMGKWTGDHCMDHKLVPGILLSNRPILVDDPDLKDLPTTILNFYGIPPHPQMRGRVVLAP
jgi:predicted AlkP superfamily phosphohydrolase/phosphomutase